MSKLSQEIQGANQNPYEIFQKEHPEVVARFNDLIEARRALKGLDAKAKQLINIAIQSANRNPRGVQMHAMMAKQRVQLVTKLSVK
ncbi:carboxymuconolactone decarboxylase family protein [Methanosarcina sp.]|uniref:carboxymuconolactone decarboxylase family protein n=1 Tax=Methanosarcina sp. TaxID=2213 RepID=UPI003C7709B8